MFIEFGLGRKASGLIEHPTLVRIRELNTGITLEGSRWGKRIPVRKRSILTTSTVHHISGFRHLNAEHDSEPLIHLFHATQSLF